MLQITCGPPTIHSACRRAIIAVSLWEFGGKWSPSYIISSVALGTNVLCRHKGFLQRREDWGLQMYLYLTKEMGTGAGLSADACGLDVFPVGKQDVDPEQLSTLLTAVSLEWKLQVLYLEPGSSYFPLLPQGDGQ